MSNIPDYSSEPGGLGSLHDQASPSLGSLKQHAQSKNLRSARVALIVACIVMAIMAVANYLTAEKQIDDEIKKELKHLGAGAMEQKEVKLAKEGMMRVLGLLCLGIGFISLVFLILAILVYRYPLFCTVGGLIFFIGFNLIMAFLIALNDAGGAVAFLVSGFIWKIIILAGLFKGIQSAVAFQRERRETQNFHDSQLQTDV
jgi:hypothetical protein